MNEIILQEIPQFRKRAIEIDDGYLEIFDEIVDPNDGRWKTTNSIFVSYSDIENIYDEFKKKIIRRNHD